MKEEPQGRVENGKQQMLEIKTTDDWEKQKSPGKLLAVESGSKGFATGYGLGFKLIHLDLKVRVSHATLTPGLHISQTSYVAMGKSVTLARPQFLPL